MPKKLIARILLVALLAQCLPVNALADAADPSKHLMPQAELDALLTAYTPSDGMPVYHKGMDYQESFNIWQVAGYLQALEDDRIEPLMNAVELLETSLPKPVDKDDPLCKKLDGYMFNLYELRDSIADCRQAINEGMTYIVSYAGDVWNAQDYTLTERVSFSRQIEQAEARIETARGKVDTNHADWETTIGLFERAIRIDGDLDVVVMDGAGAPSVSESGKVASFGTVLFVYKGADNSGELRGLYKALREPAEPKISKIPTADLGLTKAPSLLERLSPVRSAYDAREQDATVTVIDDNQIGFTVRDMTDEPLEGVTVRAVDNALMFDEKYKGADPPFVEATTNKDGVAVFDIPGNFTLQKEKTLCLYVEFKKTDMREINVWQLEIKRGGAYTVHMEADDGTPYLISATYNGLDIRSEMRTIYYCPTDATEHELYFKLGHAGESHYIQLSYLNVKKDTIAVSAYADKNGVVRMDKKWRQMFSPGNPITIEIRGPEGYNSDPIQLNLQVERGQMDNPYVGQMKALDLMPSSLFNVTLPGDFGKQFQLGLDLPFMKYIPSVVWVPNGSLSISLGYKFVDTSYVKNDKEIDFLDYDGELPRTPKEYVWRNSDEKKNEENGYFREQFQRLQEKWTKFNTLGESGFEEKNVSFFIPITMRVAGFVSVMGRLVKDGERGDGKSDGRLLGSVTVGGSFTTSSDLVNIQAGPAFVGLSISFTLGISVTVGMTSDVVWNSPDDYDVGKVKLDLGSTGLTIYGKLTIEGYLGAGLRGFIEASVHGFAYIECTIAFNVDVGEGVPVPRIVVSWGFTFYLIIKFIFFRMRFELFPSSMTGGDRTLYDNWAGIVTDEDVDPPKDSGALTLASVRDDYNPDMRAVQTTGAALEPVTGEIQTLDGKVRYARISGGKQLSTSDDVHTYAFYLSEADTNGRSWLKYVDLDLANPQEWAVSSLPQPENVQLYPYAFAVTSVEDMMDEKDGKPEHPGSSAVVCVLSCTQYDTQDVDMGNGVVMKNARVPGGDCYASFFVATRNDDGTGRLNLDVFEGDQSYRFNHENSGLCIKLERRDGQSGCYQNPQIAAAFKHTSVDASPYGVTENPTLDVNVYEAVVLLDPLDGDEAAGLTNVLRYRAAAYDSSNRHGWVVSADHPAYQALVERLHTARQDRVKLSVDSKQSGGKTHTVGGETKTAVLLPFEIDWTDGAHLWYGVQDRGPMADWIEVRAFGNANDAGHGDMLYHFYEMAAYAGGGQSAAQALTHYADWQPLNDNVPNEGQNRMLLGRAGAALNSVVIPWNAKADEETTNVFFTFQDEKGNGYLDCAQLSQAGSALADFGFNFPGVSLSCMETEDSVTFYQIASHSPPDKTQTDSCYSLEAALYGKNDGLLYDSFTVAELVTPAVNGEAPTPVLPFISEEGDCYYAALSPTQDEPTGSAGYAVTGSEASTLTFYKFKPQYVMGIDLTAAEFLEGAAEQGSYDDILLSVTNNGSTPLNGFTVGVYDVTGGTETLLETIYADFDEPDESYVEYSGVTDTVHRVTGKDVIWRESLISDATNSGKWLVTEAKTQAAPAGAAASAPDPMQTFGSCEAAYLTAGVLMPEDKATFRAPIKIGQYWSGTHTIRFRIDEIYSPEKWAIDIEGNEKRGLHSENAPGEIVARRSGAGNGLCVQYTGMTAGKDGLPPENYRQDINFDLLDLDTSKEDVEMTCRRYTKDGVEMLELTVHNRAEKDDERKCVVLFAYGDYDYENAWQVYDFDDLNAGTTRTLNIPLETVMNGRDMNALTLDLQVDLDTNHSTHARGGLNTGNNRDLHVYDDLITLPINHSPLEITRQPGDQRMASGGVARFSVDVYGGYHPYSYQWQVRKPLLDANGRHILDEHGNWKYGEWEDLPGETRIALELAATPERNGWQFRVIVRDDSGAEQISAFATLWLTDVPQTGDDAPVALWALLACAALVTALATALITAKKRKRQNRTR